MQETIDRPAEVADEVVDAAPVTTEVALLGPLQKIKTGLDNLRNELAGKTYDLTTTAGDKLARQDRLRCVTIRTSVDAAYETANKPVLKAQRDARELRDQIKADVIALEQPIDAVIKADEQRRADEKAEAARIEAARVASLRARLEAIRSCVAKSHGISSERIAKGIAAVEAIPVEGAAWEEFEAEAVTAKAETLDAMRALFASAKAAEDAAAAAEALRAENERRAAELQAQADALAEQKRRDDAERTERERVAADERAAFEREKADFARQQAEAAEAARRAAEPAPAAPEPIPEPTVAAAPIEAPAPDLSVRETIAAQPAAEQPTLKLGEITRRLAPVSIDAQGLALLGFTCAATKGPTRLYAEASWPVIKAAIVKHINSLD